MSTAADNPPPTSSNITHVTSLVTAQDRRRTLGHRPATVWLTGLSGSGKSTLARELEKRLVEAGCTAYMLDGDNVRYGLNRDLGFSDKDRTENIRRIGEVANLFNNAGMIVVTAFISPFRRDRQNNRAIIGTDRFLEVFVDAPLDVCEKRDPKGLYKKARAGRIAGFTGVQAPYEAPEAPDVHLDTSRMDVAECVDTVIAELQRRNILPA